jgi:hypothetical protein
VEEFQDNCDDFFHLWVEIFGVGGVINYIHLIGSGHMQDFLMNYGCLYFYTQQGWEALMGKVQAFSEIITSTTRIQSSLSKNRSKNQSKRMYAAVTDCISFAALQ